MLLAQTLASSALALDNLSPFHADDSDATFCRQSTTAPKNAVTQQQVRRTQLQVKQALRSSGDQACPRTTEERHARTGLLAPALHCVRQFRNVFGAPFVALNMERKRIPVRLLIAFIRPDKLEAVQKAIRHEDVELMTVSEVLDCRKEDSVEIYRGRKVRRMMPRFRLEIAVTDAFLAATIEAIMNFGDGKVFVVDLDKSVRIIRTNGRMPAELGGLQLTRIIACCQAVLTAERARQVPVSAKTAICLPANAALMPSPSQTPRCQRKQGNRPVTANDSWPPSII